jgi:protocatechuate 3,4-dioxygenase beta subunit
LQNGFNQEVIAMENDDQQIGQVLSRREVLALFGAVGAAMLAACAPGQATQPTTAARQATASGADATPTINREAQTAVSVGNNPTAAAQNATVAAANATTLPACIVRPALTEGPYFVDEKLNRSDIRSDPADNTVKEGAPLNLTVRVSQINGTSPDACTPLAKAQVDIWHCDALGVYSDASDPNFGSTRGKKFLRGYQVTDGNGQAQFTTIYPGWYQGRAVHIHFKIRTPAANKSYDFTSQWFFDDALSLQVYAQAPYATKGTRGIMKNSSDGIYQQSGGQTILNVSKNGQGYAATFDIGLQIS